MLTSLRRLELIFEDALTDLQLSCLSAAPSLADTLESCRRCRICVSSARTPSRVSASSSSRLAHMIEKLELADHPTTHSLPMNELVAIAQ